MMQYRKSKKVGPLRFTASNRGISASVGSGPLRVTRRADGRYQRTLQVPGTGIRDTRVVGGQRNRLVQPQGQPSTAANVGKLVLLLPLLGFILSVVTGSLAVGCGIVGGISVAVFVGVAVVLIRSRMKTVK
jgi:hypothetical protein